MNRIDALFARKTRDVLSVFYTAGYPSADDTLRIAQVVESAGADMIEIGIPFSDPIADGPVIQRCNTTALRQGMSVRKLFDQLKRLRPGITVPTLLMGYFNPILLFGVSRFLDECASCGVDGLIVPDWPWEESHPEEFQSRGLHRVLLVTPQTPPERMADIDSRSTGFVYAVSSFGTTGQTQVSDEAYLRRLRELRNPVMVGFGIRSANDIERVRPHCAGVIVGSAFLERLTTDVESARIFLQNLRRSA